MESQTTSKNVGNIIGRVKWFNNQRGFGFISYSEGENDNDIFVHHSGIKTKREDSFKTLKPGEYVSFNITECNENEKGHKEHAVCVTGVNGGPLLIDVQQEIRMEKKKRNIN